MMHGIVEDAMRLQIETRWTKFDAHCKGNLALKSQTLLPVPTMRPLLSVDSYD
jgi:hypothetical protein